MKNILAILIWAACTAFFAISGNAEPLSAIEVAGHHAFPSGTTGGEAFAKVLSVAPDSSLEVFSGSSLAPFVPIHLDQFVISLLDTASESDVLKENHISSPPRFQLNTGIKTERYLTDPQSLFTDGLFGSNTSSNPLGISSSVVFVGVGFDFNSVHLQGNAYVGRPLDTLSSKLRVPQSYGRVENQGVDSNAYGFEASAGYQLSDMIALGAGVERMTDKNKETDQTEDVYAVYAQAILAVAPGVQVKPEVGRVDRIKEESNIEEIDQSFYAGAIWEINF